MVLEPLKDMPPFPEYIKRGIEKKIAECGGSAKALSDKLRLPQSNISRYRNSGCKMTSPNAKSVLGLVAEDKRHYAQLLLHYFPEESEQLIKVFLDYGNVPVELPVVSILNRDPIYYYIYALAGLDRGLPLDFVAEHWNDIGMERGQELVNCGYLVLEEDKFSRPEKRKSYGDLYAIRNHIKYLANDFPVECVHKNEACMANMMGNLNEQGIPALTAAVRKAAQLILDVVEDPELQGNIPVSISLLGGKTRYSDSFAKHVEKQKNEAEKK